MASKYWENQIQATRDRGMNQGDQINQGISDQISGYGDQQKQFEQDASTALDNLNQTPGYTSDEATAIEGQQGLDALGNIDYNANFLTPNQQSEIAGDPYQALKNYNPDRIDTAQQDATRNITGTAAGDEGGLDQQVSQAQKNIQGSVDPSALKMSGAYSDQIDNVLNTTADRTYGAIDPSKLSTSSDYNQNYNFTPQDQQDMVTAAGRTVGMKAQADDDAAMRAAAADGNTSPAALAAIKERNDINAGAEAGDAMTNARIQAKQAALGVTQQKEQTRLGAEQDISSREMTAANQLGNLADTAVQQRENTRLGAEQTLTGDQLAAAEASGQFGTNAATYKTSLDTGVQQQIGQQNVNEAEYEQQMQAGLINTGEQESSQRAGQIATNQQQTNEQNQQNQFNRGYTVNQAESGRAGQVANQRIAGQNTYLQGVTAQEQMGQQGQQTAQGQQISNYNTQYQLADTANQQAATYSMWQQQQPSTAATIAGAAIGAAPAVASFFDDGGVVGPEGVIEGNGMPTGDRNPTGLFSSGVNGDFGNETKNPATAGTGFWSRLQASLDHYKDNIPGATPPGQPTGQQQNNAPSGGGGILGGFNQGVQAGQSIGKAATSIADAFDDGGTEGEGTLGMVGEDGPEMVFDPKNPDSAQLVTKPTIAKLGTKGKEMIVPLNPKKSAKLRPGMAMDVIKGYRNRALHSMPTHRFDDGGVAQPYGGPQMQSNLQPAMTQPNMTPPAAPQGPAMRPPQQQYGMRPGQPQQMSRYRQFAQPQAAPAPVVQQPPQQSGWQQPQPQQGQPQMLANGGIIGSLKNRYRKPTGPVGPHGPIRPLEPMKGLPAFR